MPCLPTGLLFAPTSGGDLRKKIGRAVTTFFGDAGAESTKEKAHDAVVDAKDAIASAKDTVESKARGIKDAVKDRYSEASKVASDNATDVRVGINKVERSFE